MDFDTHIVQPHKWALTRQYLSLRFPIKQDPNIETSYKFEIPLVARLAIILSNKQITKVLIRLRECAGWSAPLMFANTEDRFSWLIRLRHVLLGVTIPSICEPVNEIVLHF